MNAPLVSVNAPFDGIVEVPSLGPARAVQTGDAIVELRKDRGQNGAVRALDSELETISGEIVALQMQRERLQMLSHQLKERRDAQIEARVAWYKVRLQEAQADVHSAEGALTRAEAAADRAQRLQERGRMAESDAIEAQADLAEARAALEREKAVVERMRIEQSYLADGDVIDLSTNDIERVDYRIDELALRDADLDSQLLARQSRRAALKREIDALEVETLRNERFRPLAAAEGVIWESSGQQTATVSTGEQVVQLLDCSRRFLEFILPERYFEAITPGTPVSVQLKGSDETFEAEISAVYGGGARPNLKMQAAQPRLDNRDGLRVIVRMPPVDVSDVNVARGFCDVGRSAEVRFQGKYETNVAGLVQRVRDVTGLFPDAVALDGQASGGAGRTVTN
ncbi:HlyD family efflux transporter periplasmic adaptor subunit [Pseudooceanicola nanhaiensis]|uniref:HlyD family efflux transporter periplasmic adaptor subunit n=1 Tax=Pseudooceanicola nanhaiensis TaxID=375761 RepID=UPI001CD24059|nr:HlyD family efflux transporter periplasmic adaptor subunit [Pseudooceanicola nanhaiensis]MCA0921990.1 HlyD family efflux transporter periplasmic adaptor subunit [Pseudooceanicola nanhaiensis]